MTAQVLLYDGDCGVCTRLAAGVTRWVRRSPEHFVVRAYQEVDLAPLGLTAQQCDAALQWVGVDGRVRSGEDAVARLLCAGRMWQRPVGMLLLAPGVNTLARVLYSWVAANRQRLPGGTPACSLPASQRPA